MTFLREGAVVPACVETTARLSTRRFGATASAPIDGVSDSIGRRRRPLSFRAAILTGELVLEVPGRLAVAHHDDRGLLARALAQRALRGAEQHDATLWLLELRLLRALRCSKAQFWGKRA